jgi:hypothetical protein
MPKYRKRPVVVEATQWFKNGDHPLDYATETQGLEGGKMRSYSPEERRGNGWEGEVVRYFRHPLVDGTRPCAHCGLTMHEHGHIDTLEGGHVVCPGDWVITGVKGEHYPCKPDIFAATYEPVEDTQFRSHCGCPMVPASDESDSDESWITTHLPDCKRSGHWLVFQRQTVSKPPITAEGPDQ